MKESYEYLMDQYGVKVLVNREYAEKNITRASTSGMAKSRLKALDRMEVLDRPEMDRRTAAGEGKRRPYSDVFRSFFFKGIYMGTKGRYPVRIKRLFDKIQLISAHVGV